MIAKQKLRVGALCAVVAATLIGVATRFDSKNAGDFEVLAFDAPSLSEGDAIGTAAFAGAVNRPKGVRLRVAGCGDPAFVIPIWILSAAEPRLADRAYPFPAYRSTDVYRGQIHEGFSHGARWASYYAVRVNALWSHALPVSSAFYYARTYMPSNCVAENEAYVEWATAVLKLGHKVARSGDAPNLAVTSR